MKPKTELFLYHLLWSAEALTRPTFRNLNQSFEGWAYRNGLDRQVARLERERFIERKGNNSDDDRVYRLSERGRLRALGGRDPMARWSRRWDGYWRLVLFDVPMTRNVERQRLRRYLRGRAFGCLQKSVWITPDPLREEAELLQSARAEVQALLLLQAKACAGESDHDIVATAWDFDAINAGYRNHLAVLEKRPGRVRSKTEAKYLQLWAESEWGSWRGAVSLDPLLPRRLWPVGYLGERAWDRRREVLSDLKQSVEKLVL